MASIINFKHKIYTRNENNNNPWRDYGVLNYIPPVYGAHTGQKLETSTENLKGD